MRWKSIGKFAVLATVGAFVFAAVPGSADEARGRELLTSLGCKGCHQLEGAGGRIGPALDGIGNRFDAEKLHKQLVDPRSFNANTMMPSYGHVKSEDLQALVDFLAAQK